MQLGTKDKAKQPDWLYRKNVQEQYFSAKAIMCRYFEKPILQFQKTSLFTFFPSGKLLPNLVQALSNKDK
jgi:hypothetical protein